MTATFIATNDTENTSVILNMANVVRIYETNDHDGLVVESVGGVKTLIPEKNMTYDTLLESLQEEGWKAL